MELIKIYLMILLPVVAALALVYTNFYVKKKLKELKKKKEEEEEYVLHVRHETEKVLAEHLKLHNNGDLVEDQEES
ncbi:MAG: hypothetical protein KAX49_13325 [Halanaerobiales bacterium]|nr:hypothetical protein [Halanaerobiales bacterium]